MRGTEQRVGRLFVTHGTDNDLISSVRPIHSLLWQGGRKREGDVMSEGTSMSNNIDKGLFSPAVFSRKRRFIRGKHRKNQVHKQGRGFNDKFSNTNHTMYFPP